MARTAAGPDPAPEEEFDLGEIEDEAEDDAGDEQEQSGDDGGQALDDETDDATEEGQQEDPDVGPPRRGRAAETIRRLRREAREARDEVRGLRQRFEGFERGSRQAQFDPHAQALAEERERQEVALKSPEEQSRYWYDKGRREFGGAMAQMEARLLDQADRRDFQALCRSDRLAAKLAPQVEEAIARERQAGNFRSTREDALNYLYGMEARKRATQQTPRQRAQAQRRVQAQTVRPRSGGSDVGRGRGRESEYEAALRRSGDTPF